MSSVECHDWTEVRPEKKWWILSQQKRFAMWALYTSVGCMMMGFDFGIAGTATAFPAFQKVMGKPYPSQPSGYLIPAGIQSAWAGVSTAGDVIGIAISGQLMTYIGRKHTIAFGSVLTAVGIAVQVAAHDWKVFLGGRLINALGFGMVFIIPLVWIGENVRPELRGTFLCVQNCSIVISQFILALVAYGTQNIQGKWSYQTLVVLQFLFVVILAVGYPFFPESPYFLLKNRGNEEGARKSLRSLYGTNKGNLIEAEIARLKEDIRMSEELAALAGHDGHPFLQAFKGSNRKRTLIAMLAASSQQFIGAGFVLSYVTYFLELLGISNYFEVSVALECVMVASNLAAFPLVEVLGRRALLVPGIFSMTVILLVMGIGGCIVNAAALWIILVCIFLWAIAYQVSVGAVGFALSAELPTLTLRPTTISISTCFLYVLGWAINFSTPYMINPDAGNLGGKVGFVFMGFGVPLCILFWLFIPETKGLNHDEIDQLFADDIKPRHFKRESARRKALAAGGGEEDDFKGATVKTIEAAA